MFNISTFISEPEAVEKMMPLEEGIGVKEDTSEDVDDDELDDYIDGEDDFEEVE